MRVAGLADDPQCNLLSWSAIFANKSIRLMGVGMFLLLVTMGVSNAWSAYTRKQLATSADMGLMSYGDTSLSVI